MQRTFFEKLIITLVLAAITAAVIQFTRSMVSKGSGLIESRESLQKLAPPSPAKRPGANQQNRR